MKRRLAYQGRAITVWDEEVELPNGSVAKLDIVRHPGAAAVVPFVTQDEVVLIRQHRHAAGDAAARAAGVGQVAKSSGVTSFTFLSVHCADRMVATSSSQGERWSSSHQASG